MAKKINLEGMKFGRLLVLCQADRLGIRTRWLCKCDCGAEKAVATGHLRSGRTASCGCKKQEGNRLTHGMTGTRVHQIWQAMRARCSRPDPRRSLDYKTRGITVCERWMTSFESFLEDMGVPGDHQSIDRIDNDGNYEPGNCRWATASEQAINKTNTRKVLVNGVEVAVHKAAKEAGISKSAIDWRWGQGRRSAQELLKVSDDAR